MDPQQPESQMTEEELRAAYEAQLKQVRVEDVLVQTVVALLNLGARKAALGAGGNPQEDEKDPEQLRQAIEAARVLLPMVEGALGVGGDEIKQLRDVLAQLQMAYAREAPAGTAPAAGDTQTPQGPGPAQSSGRLWVPGQ